MNVPICSAWLPAGPVQPPSVTMNDVFRAAMPYVWFGLLALLLVFLCPPLATWLPRLMGAGRAAWLVLTGEAIDARRALEWGLVEEVASDPDLAVGRVVQSLLAASPKALREQKRLLQLWDEASLATSVAASIAAFSRTTISSTERSRGN